MPKPFPWYYAVNDRPVQIVELPDGGSDALVFDFATGGFVPDRSYFGRASDTGIGKDVDQLTADEFDGLVSTLRRPIAARRRASPLVWERTGDGEFPYRIQVNESTLTLRVNDFPAEPLYSLLVDGRVVEDFEDWPPAWVRPAGRPELPDSRRQSSLVMVPEPWPSASVALPGEDRSTRVSLPSVSMSPQTTISTGQRGRATESTAGA